MKYRMIIVTAFCIIQSAVVAQSPIKALNIGDQVPDITINNLINYKTENGKPATLKISDFKGRLLILDFWSTWCGSCIEFLPKVDSLNKQFHGKAYILPVTEQKADLIQKFLSSNDFLKDFKITSVVNDLVLKKLFPHSQIPHEVWIDPQGKLIATTADEYVNAENISQVLTGHKPTLDTKNDKIDYDSSKPLFYSDNNIKLQSGSVLYTTTFTGYLDGIPPNQQVKTDTTKHIKRYSFVNQPILNLYGLILNSGLPFTPTRRKLQVSDPNIYVYNAKSGYHNDWDKANTYSYEAIVPLSFSTNEVLVKLRTDMERLLKITGSIQSQEIDCWILHPNSSDVKLKTAYTKQVVQINPGHPLLMHRISAADLEYILNQREDCAPVINESATSLPFDLDFKFVPVTLEEWNNALKPIGLEFSLQKRSLEMFILSQMDKK